MTLPTEENTSSSWDYLKHAFISTGVLLYCASAMGLMLLFKSRWIEGLLVASITLTVIAVILSLFSQIRYHKKIEHINGIENIEKEEIQQITLLKSWIDIIGDRGIAYINICLILFVFPSIFAASYHLNWGLFDLRPEMISALNQELDFFDWLLVL